MNVPLSTKMSGFHHAHRLSEGRNSDLFQGWGTLVTVLVAVHVAAFLFWILMALSPSSSQPKAEEKKD